MTSGGNWQRDCDGVLAIIQQIWVPQVSVLPQDAEGTKITRLQCARMIGFITGHDFNRASLPEQNRKL